MNAAPPRVRRRGLCGVRGWAMVDSLTGDAFPAASATVLSPTLFRLHYPGSAKDSCGWVLVPHQDVNVQNFGGGFAQGGGTWFRVAG